MNIVRLRHHKTLNQSVGSINSSSVMVHNEYASIIESRME